METQCSLLSEYIPMPVEPPTTPEVNAEPLTDSPGGARVKPTQTGPTGDDV